MARPMFVTYPTAEDIKFIYINGTLEPSRGENRSVHYNYRQLMLLSEYYSSF